VASWLKYAARNVLPERVYHGISALRDTARYVGLRRYCPACGKRSARFRDFDLTPLHVEGGIIPAQVIPQTVCPWCGSQLHHRLLWTILPDVLRVIIREKPAAQRPKVLHFAPERFSVPRLSMNREIDYLTTDFARGDVNLRLDICHLGLARESIDLVVASHVLEHVPSDVEAIAELWRILVPRGTALLLVPLLASKSYELDNVTSPEERVRLYGQDDHVRAYGLDFADRLRARGFSVETITAVDAGLKTSNEYISRVQGVLFKAIKREAKVNRDDSI